jgi:hypothetical protein
MFFKKKNKKTAFDGTSMLAKKTHMKKNSFFPLLSLRLTFFNKKISYPDLVSFFFSLSSK